jgi:succinoglycan biosynthesis protein ExoM
MEARRVDSALPLGSSEVPRLAAESMTNKTPHISVCICTYKRPRPLRRLLEELRGQETSGLFTYSIVVADNDHLESAKPVVASFATASATPIRYCVEPRQNIALARNKAVENAAGDFVAFIDDDEFPEKQWLLNLFKTCREYGADGVLGPVQRHFDAKPPEWIIKGDFYKRPRHSTGFVMNWGEARTGNLLLNKRILSGGELPFKPEFRAGEDQDFFRRMIGKGHLFVWCDEAVAHEVIPPNRWKRTYMLRKALLRGATAVLHPTFGKREIVKSLIAVPAYAVALPFMLVLGQDKFMDRLVRLFDHLGKLLELVGLNPVREAYISDTM